MIERLPLDPQQPELVGTYFNQWMCTRQYAEAARALQDLLANPALVGKHLAGLSRAARRGKTLERRCGRRARGSDHRPG